MSAPPTCGQYQSWCDEAVCSLLRNKFKSKGINPAVKDAIVEKVGEDALSENSNPVLTFFSYFISSSEVNCATPENVNYFIRCLNAAAVIRKPVIKNYNPTQDQISRFCSLIVDGLCTLHGVPVPIGKTSGLFSTQKPPPQPATESQASGFSMFKTSRGAAPAAQNKYSALFNSNIMLPMELATLLGIAYLSRETLYQLYLDGALELPTVFTRALVGGVVIARRGIFRENNCHAIAALELFAFILKALTYALWEYIVGFAPATTDRQRALTNAINSPHLLKGMPQNSARDRVHIAQYAVQYASAVAPASLLTIVSLTWTDLKFGTMLAAAVHWHSVTVYGGSFYRIGGASWYTSLRSELDTSYASEMAHTDAHLKLTIDSFEVKNPVIPNALVISIEDDRVGTLQVTSSQFVICARDFLVMMEGYLRAHARAVSLSKNPEYMAISEIVRLSSPAYSFNTLLRRAKKDMSDVTVGRWLFNNRYQMPDSEKTFDLSVAYIRPIIEAYLQAFYSKGLRANDLAGILAQNKKANALAWGKLSNDLAELLYFIEGLYIEHLQIMQDMSASWSPRLLEHGALGAAGSK